MTDSIADMLTRIRNGYLAKKSSVDIPHSRIKETLAKILEKEGYVSAVEVQRKKHLGIITLNLAYQEGAPAIEGIERISTSGRKVYAKAGKLPKTLGGYGITIISTSRGMMTDREAKKSNLGGEVICRVW